MFNRLYLDPLSGRGSPTDAIHDHVVDGHLKAHHLPFVQPGDLDEISVPTDFLGINNYSRSVCRASDPPGGHNLPVALEVGPPEAHTDIGWEVAPTGLRDLLMRVHRDYAPPSIVITENGASYADGPSPDGQVHDARRQAYFEGHLGGCHEAIAAGVPLHGYFAWSLMDNFEWAYGYAQRFGLVHVDYETQQRTPKDSLIYLAGVMAQNALPT
jgi:beta-glucosidase